jgi:hydrogenase maturation protease
MSFHQRILIACVGNIFLGDDAFGVEVARSLSLRTLPEDVRVVDFGIRGLDLTYALLDDYEAVILVDATPRGGPPGTLYVIEPDVNSLINEAEGDGLVVETHGMSPVKVLRAAAAMGGLVERVLLVGCEPAEVLDPEDLRDGLSEPVRAAVSEAVNLIESIAALLLRGEPIVTSGDNTNIIPGQEVGTCRD